MIGYDEQTDPDSADGMVEDEELANQFYGLSTCRVTRARDKRQSRDKRGDKTRNTY